MKKLTEIISNILKSDTFFKIIALIIAIGFWLYTITVEDNIQSKTYQDIPVTFAYEGSVPYNNGLMPLVTSRSYYVAVRVSGKRADMLNFSKGEIQVMMDFSRITQEGTYKVPLIVSSKDPNISATIIGDDEISMEFTESSTVSLAVTVKQLGNYAPGYEELHKNVSPKTITIQGPKDIVDKIRYAETQISVTNINQSFSELADILLLAEDRSYIDRTYLTTSSSTANVEVELAYREALKVLATPINNLGGNEDSYTTISYSSPYVTFEGDESLFTTGTLIIGDIALEDIKTQTTTRSYKIIPPAGLTCVDDIREIEVTIDMGESEVKNTKITATALRDCHIRNIPAGVTAKVDLTSVYVTLRALPYVHETPNVTSWYYYVDLNDTPNEEGKYPLHIELPSDVPAGLLSQAYVTVTLEEVTE